MRYPLMNEEDAVKFVFQAMLGVGHLIASRDGALERLMQEMDAQEPYEGEPLTEALSDEWFRLNLRAARSRGIPAADIADMLLFSAGRALSYSRRDVYDFCVQLDKSERMRKCWMSTGSPPTPRRTGRHTGPRTGCCTARF